MAGIRPAMQRIVVVFPVPLGPLGRRFSRANGKADVVNCQIALVQFSKTIDFNHYKGLHPTRFAHTHHL